MTDSIVPPEGQLSFSGIPSAEFIEDVDSHMAAEESAESPLKVIWIYFDIRIVCHAMKIVLLLLIHSL